MKFETKIVKDCSSFEVLTPNVVKYKWGESAEILEYWNTGTHGSGGRIYNCTIRRSFADARERETFHKLTNQGLTPDMEEYAEIMEWIDRHYPISDCDMFSSNNIQFKPQVNGNIDFETNRQVFIPVVVSSGTSVELYGEELLYVDESHIERGNYVSEQHVLPVPKEFIVEEVVNHQPYCDKYECYTEVRLYDLNKVFENCPEGYCTFVCIPVDNNYYKIT